MLQGAARLSAHPIGGPERLAACSAVSDGLFDGAVDHAIYVRAHGLLGHGRRRKAVFIVVHAPDGHAEGQAQRGAHDDAPEIEVDLAALDNGTLWKLQEFADTCNATKKRHGHG